MNRSNSCCLRVSMASLQNRETNQEQNLSVPYVFRKCLKFREYRLLLNACPLSIRRAMAIARNLGAGAYAHLQRPAQSLAYAMLIGKPQSARRKNVEFRLGIGPVPLGIGRVGRACAGAPRKGEEGKNYGCHQRFNRHVFLHSRELPRPRTGQTKTFSQISFFGKRSRAAASPGLRNLTSGIGGC